MLFRCAKLACTVSMEVSPVFIDLNLFSKGISYAQPPNRVLSEPCYGTGQSKSGCFHGDLIDLPCMWTKKLDGPFQKNKLTIRTGPLGAIASLDDIRQPASLQLDCFIYSLLAKHQAEVLHLINVF
jgi:hypothetical protein